MQAPRLLRNTTAALCGICLLQAGGCSILELLLPTLLNFWINALLADVFQTALP